MKKLSNTKAELSKSVGYIKKAWTLIICKNFEENLSSVKSTLINTAQYRLWH